MASKPREITPEDVWEAYKYLIEYARFVGVVGKLKVPFQISDSIPPKKFPLVQEVATQINEQDKDFIIQCDEVYYAYLYLFVQLIRCSQRSGPYFMDASTGWKNLAWFPLTTLKGREGVANRSWQGWYASTLYGKRLEEVNLQTKYPLISKAGEADAEVAKKQVIVLNGIKTRTGIDFIQLLLHYDLSGILHTKKTSSWHPWLLLALPEAWDTHLNVEMVPKLVKLLKEESNWDYFCNTFVPLMNKKRSIQKTNQSLLMRLDAALNYNSNIPLKKKWKLLRRALLKSPYAEDNRTTVY